MKNRQTGKTYSGKKKNTPPARRGLHSAILCLISYLFVWSFQCRTSHPPINLPDFTPVYEFTADFSLHGRDTGNHVPGNGMDAREFSGIMKQVKNGSLSVLLIIPRNPSPTYLLTLQLRPPGYQPGRGNGY
jgi:hypothetical protein